MVITSEPAASDSPEAAPESKSVRLEYLDGLRGLSALYVVLNHCSLLSMIYLGDFTGRSSHAAKILHYLFYGVFIYGNYAVCFFIVLSGYCLMLPVVQSESENLRGGFWGFAERRARRILPPYYAALGLCLLLFVAGPSVGIDTPAMNWFESAGPPFVFWNVTSHLLLLHCWTPWLWRIDPPMWSVSLEWNIYFVFALLLLPLFRKFGIGAVLVVAFLLSLVPHVFFHCAMDRMHPWMLGLFALGMFAATINFSSRPQAKYLLRRVHWGWASLVVAACLVLSTYIHGRASFRMPESLSWIRPDYLGGPFVEILAGMLASGLIIWSTRCLSSVGKLPIVLRLLESKAVVRLGTFSYSLYLIHDLVIELTWLVTKKLAVRPLNGALAMYFLAVPLAVGVAYIFHLAFERPFLSRHYRKVLQQT